MTYSQAIRYLESFINYEKTPLWPYRESLKLEPIKEFLAAIGNPQDSLRCIHIAGTKGKGSTCAFVTYILREAGYKVGLYTSPHLSDFRERIRILNPNPLTPACPAGRGNPKPEFEGMISKNELVRLVERFRPCLKKFNSACVYGPLSFFEVYTALAFVYFKDKNVDFAVLETGLGGRLDATNVVNPLVCAITPISYEHTQKLGSTLREIATEKAGIIKGHPITNLLRHRLIVINAPQEKEAGRVLREKCQEIGCELYEVGKDISYKRVTGYGLRVTGQTFKIKGIFGEYPDLKIRLLGEHQLINASVAVGAIEALQFYNINVGVDSIRGGLSHTLWPGRCEVIAKKPLVVLDGAQNVASCQALRQAVKKNFNYNKLILVLGISSDKDIKGICEQVCPLADGIILTQASNPRAASVNDIEKIIRAQGIRADRVWVIKTKKVRKAKAIACRLAKPRDLILICGSLFVVGEFRDAKA